MAAAGGEQSREKNQNFHRGAVGLYAAPLLVGVCSRRDVRDQPPASVASQGPAYGPQSADNGGERRKGSAEV